MKRRLFTILSALSLLLFVAVCVLWVKSYFSADLIHFANSPHPPVVTEWFVRSNYGLLYFARNDHEPGSMMEPRPLDWMIHPADRGFRHPVVQRRSPCFVLGMFSLGGTRTHLAFTVPHWSLAAVTAIAPAFWLAGCRRTRRRIISGLCRSCGYDLRASPDQCPECGAAPARAPA